MVILLRIDTHFDLVPEGCPTAVYDSYQQKYDIFLLGFASKVHQQGTSATMRQPSVFRKVRSLMSFHLSELRLA
jgi:hypothetical protein